MAHDDEGDDPVSVRTSAVDYKALFMVAGSLILVLLGCLGWFWSHGADSERAADAKQWEFLREHDTKLWKLENQLGSLKEQTADQEQRLRELEKAARPR